MHFNTHTTYYLSIALNVWRTDVKGGGLCLNSTPHVCEGNALHLLSLEQTVANFSRPLINILMWFLDTVKHSTEQLRQYANEGHGCYTKQAIGSKLSANPS